MYSKINLKYRNYINIYNNKPPLRACRDGCNNRNFFYFAFILFTVHKKTLSPRVFNAGMPENRWCFCSCRQ